MFRNSFYQKPALPFHAFVFRIKRCFYCPYKSMKAINKFVENSFYVSIQEHQYLSVYANENSEEFNPGSHKIRSITSLQGLKGASFVETSTPPNSLKKALWLGFIMFFSLDFTPISPRLRLIHMSDNEDLFRYSS